MKIKTFIIRAAATSGILLLAMYVMQGQDFGRIGKTSIFNVSDGDVAGLITAINNANNEIANPGPDVINLAANGTYTLTTVNNSDATYGDSGLPTVTSNITINGNNSLIQRSSAGGTPAFRIMLVGATGNITINDTTLKNGLTGTANDGGGMRFAAGSLGSLNNVTFDGNFTNTSGAGLRHSGNGLLTINNSTFINNHANSSGAAIVNDPIGGGVTSMIITNTLIDNNSAGSAAGGIENTGKMSLDNVTVSNNTAPSAGGIRDRSGIMTITNSLIKGNSATSGSQTGGGILCSNSDDTISNTIIENNTSNLSGGGISATATGVRTLTITNSTIRNNTATSNGGGYYGSGTITENMTNVTFSGNTANVGGGLRKDGTGTMTVNNSTIYNNSAGFAGGGLVMNANVTVNNTLFDSNVASLSNSSAYGGGFITGNTGLTSTITNSTFTNNSAPNAGALDLYSVSQLTNVTVSGNFATGSGGGIKIESSAQVTINNTTITNNTADSDANGTGTAGGLFQLGTNSTISNSIIAGNIDGTPGGVTDHVDCGGVVSSITNSGGYNLIGQINTGVPTHCHFQTTTGDQVGTVSAPINPLLGALANNGGTTFTHLLLTGSPAIDAGNPATPGSGGNACSGTDQRNVYRPADGNTDLVQQCDIGAVELDPPEVIIQQTAGSTDVSESGTTDTYSIFLNKLPTANVTVNLTPDAQVNVSVPSLLFTTANWNVPQIVTVSAVNDLVAEGSHVGVITHAAVSADANYNGISIVNLSSNITDNDAAGVSIVESGGSTDVTEGGSGDSYTVVLNTIPTNDVTITVASDSQSNSSPSPLTFTPLNWNVPQTVNVSAVDDQVAEGNHTSAITHAVSSLDPIYNGIAVQNVTVHITDNDSAGIVVTETGG